MNEQQQQPIDLRNELEQLMGTLQGAIRGINHFLTIGSTAVSQMYSLQNLQKQQEVVKEKGGTDIHPHDHAHGHHHHHTPTVATPAATRLSGSKLINDQVQRLNDAAQAVRNRQAGVAGLVSGTPVNLSSTVLTQLEEGELQTRRVGHTDPVLVRTRTTTKTHDQLLNSFNKLREGSIASEQFSSVPIDPIAEAERIIDQRRQEENNTKAQPVEVTGTTGLYNVETLPEMVDNHIKSIFSPEILSDNTGDVMINGASYKYYRDDVSLLPCNLLKSYPNGFYNDQETGDVQFYTAVTIPSGLIDGLEGVYGLLYTFQKRSSGFVCDRQLSITSLRCGHGQDGTPRWTPVCDLIRELYASNADQTRRVLESALVRFANVVRLGFYSGIMK